MARKKIREYDSKRLLKEHFKRIAGSELPVKSAQVRFFPLFMRISSSLYEKNFKYFLKICAFSCSAIDCSIKKLRVDNESCHLSFGY